MSPANRYIPPIILLVLLTGLGIYFGPGLWRTYQFNQTCNKLLSDAKAGKLSDVTAAITPGQQAQIGALLSQYVPADYNKDIESLKLVSYDKSAPETIWAIATARINQGESLGVYQAKMCWRWEKGRWWWDFDGSFGAPFSPSGEPDWIPLSNLVSLAESL
jgi:hypothetical protein